MGRKEKVLLCWTVEPRESLQGLVIKHKKFVVYSKS